MADNLADPVYITVTKTIFTVAPTPTPQVTTRTFGQPWTTATPHTWTDSRGIVYKSYPRQPQDHWQECQMEWNRIRSAESRWRLWPLIFVGGILLGLVLAILIWGIRRLHQRHAKRIRSAFKRYGRIRLEEEDGMTEGMTRQEPLVSQPAETQPAVEVESTSKP